MIHPFIFCLFSLSFRYAAPLKIQPLVIRADTCQTGKDTLTGRKIYLDADKGPECEGGTAAWLRHLNKTLGARETSSGEIRSSYTIAFIVEKDGTISGERVLGAPKSGITKQLFFAVRSIRWIPGRCHGKNVPMLYKLPIIIHYEIE
jgi:hypothetical protein